MGGVIAMWYGVGQNGGLTSFGGRLLPPASDIVKAVIGLSLTSVSGRLPQMWKLLNESRPQGHIERERAEIGVFITLEEPSSEMKLEATTAGVYTSPIDGRDYPRIHILTIAELLEEGKKSMLPLLILSPYQQAERIARQEGRRAAGAVRLTGRG